MRRRSPDDAAREPLGVAADAADEMRAPPVLIRETDHDVAAGGVQPEGVSSS